MPLACFWSAKSIRNVDIIQIPCQYLMSIRVCFRFYYSQFLFTSFTALPFSFTVNGFNYQGYLASEKLLCVFKCFIYGISLVAIKLGECSFQLPISLLKPFTCLLLQRHRHLFKNGSHFTIKFYIHRLN